MNPCEHYQPQLLNYLYGLLEESDSQSLKEHLSGCAACQAALAHVEEQRRVLAAAAKAEFAGVRFTAPAELPAALPQVIPVKAPRRNWLRWAIAASVLLVVGGIGVAGFLTWQEYSSRRQELARAKNEQEKLVEKKHNADEAIRLVQQEIRKLEEQWKSESQEIQKSSADKQLHLSIKGPKTLVPGAPNQFSIEITNRDRQPTKSELKARLVDQAGTEVPFEEKALPEPGKHILMLPPSVKIKPGTKLTLEVKAIGKDGIKAEISEKVALGEPLYLTHLTTDRPLYRPGEVVHFRSLTLDRFGLKPSTEDFHLQFLIQEPGKQDGTLILQGKAQVSQEKGKDKVALLGPDGKAITGVGAGQYQVPPGAPGGTYTLIVREAQNRFPAESRKFKVRQYQAPRLHKEVEFTRKSYGPGDEVEALCKVGQIEGGMTVNDQMQIIPTVVVDKIESQVQIVERAVKNEKLTARLRFKLPGTIEREDSGSLTVQFISGGKVETLVEPIPLVLKKLHVEFFAEGGDPIVGVSGRVYFQARTTIDKPAEIKGRIVDDKGAFVTNVQTLNDDHEAGVNQGMGLFELTPQAGRTYELKIDSPSGIEGKFLLPSAKEEGVVLRLPGGAFSEAIRGSVQSVKKDKKDRKLFIGAYCRGRLLAHQTLDAKQGQAADFALDLKAFEGVGGVYRVTVFEELRAGEKVNLKPLAERLVYRQAGDRLKLSLTPDKKHYSPGDKVKVKLTAENEKGKAAPAILLVSVVDQGVLNLANEKTARAMPTHFFLTTEVRKAEDLEHADFLLSDHPKAPVALDLLLGTQGWRRFAEQKVNPEQFRKAGIHDERVLAAIGQSPPVQKEPEQERLLAVDQKYGPGWQKLVYQEKEQKETVQKEEPQARAAATLAQKKIADANASAESFTTKVRNVGLSVLAVLLLGLTLYCLIVGLTRMSREQAGAVSYFATGMATLVILVIGGMTTLVLLFRNSVLMQQRDEAQMAQKMDRGGANLPQRGLRPGAPDMGGAFPGGGAGGMPVPAEEGAPMKKPGAKEAFPGIAPPMPKDFPGAKMPPPPMPMPPVNMPPMAGMPPPGPPPMVPGGGEMGNADGVAKFGNKMKQGGKGLGGPMAPGGFPGVMDPAGEPMADAQIAHPGDEVLIREGNFAALARGRMKRWVFLPPPLTPLVVREYAHQHQSNPDQIRTDFAETLFWHPVVVLNDGKGEVSFDLSDSVTTFRVLAWGHTLDGRLGAKSVDLTSRLPFYVEPKIPDEVSHTDKVLIPLTVTNGTTTKGDVTLLAKATGLKLIGEAERKFGIGPEQTLRRLFEFQPALVKGDVELTFKGQLDKAGSDRVTRSFKVVPEGFPIVEKKSDLLEQVAVHEIKLPALQHRIKGTLQVHAEVFPSTLAELQKGLEALLREPCGCFEQSSTSNYPNVLIMNYLKDTDQTNPTVETRAKQLMDRGYRQLTSFECLDPAKQSDKRGYEWFGGTALAHEALTAYGLLQFRDMAKVHKVDAVMLERTRKYLMDQRDGKGGFKRNPRALDTFGRAPEHITNAYIVWALTESGNEDNVDLELSTLHTQAQKSNDPYFVALVANSLINRRKSDDAVDLLKTLIKAQQEDGHLDAKETSITGSGGRDLQIETTALTVLGWLKAHRPDQFKAPVEKAVKWIGKQRGGYGGFGSTQSTILALKALIAFTRDNKKTPEAGDLILFVNDREVSRKHFEAGTQDGLVVSVPADKEELFKEGANKVRLEITGKNAFPYTLTWAYNTRKPVNPEKAPVHLTTGLSKTRATEGETVRLTAVVENKSGKGQGMTVAILGLPAGLNLPEDMKQLEELARLRENGSKPGVISFYELRGRELVLYWRDLAPAKKIEVNLDLVCRIPGEYRGPASRAYLYYNADDKFWTDPLSMAIAPKAE
jgi:hypothetical protein